MSEKCDLTLKPCPFCGKKTGRVKNCWRVTGRNWTDAYECQSCGARGPMMGGLWKLHNADNWAERAASVAERWNQRSGK